MGYDMRIREGQVYVLLPYLVFVKLCMNNNAVEELG